MNEGSFTFFLIDLYLYLTILQKVKPSVLIYIHRYIQVYGVTPSDVQKNLDLSQQHLAWRMWQGLAGWV